MFGHKTEDRLQYVTAVFYEYRCKTSGVELEWKKKAIWNHQGKETFAQSH